MWDSDTVAALNRQPGKINYSLGRIVIELTPLRSLCQSGDGRNVDHVARLRGAADMLCAGEEWQQGEGGKVVGSSVDAVRFEPGREQVHGA